MDVEMNTLGLFGVGSLIIGGIVATLIISAVVCRNVAAGFGIAFAVTVFAVALGGADKIPLFWDTPSFLMVVLTVIILVSGQGKWKLFSQGLETVLSTSTPNIPDAAETAALFRYIANGTLGGGGLWTLTGWILMFADLDPNKIGAGIAVSLLTLFYAVFLSVFASNPKSIA
ncbi:hypothetical protein FACS189443_7250 [Planctomycetales bacterium]|nr:hypothetical protein FACS189443_7250 [Planctomycetales bacterium]